MAEVVYRGILYRENATIRQHEDGGAEGDCAFLATDEPLPVGTRLRVKQAGEDAEYVVIAVQEKGERGMEIRRVESDSPKSLVHDEPTVNPALETPPSKLKN